MQEFKSTINEVTLSRIKTDIPKVKITSSTTVVEYLDKYFKAYLKSVDVYESFYVLFLNRANNVIDYVRLSHGGVSGTVVDIKLLACYAIKTLCSGVILIHNHPGGATYPSKADTDLTYRLRDGLKLLDIKVLDHIIINPELEYYSYSDEGVL